MVRHANARAFKPGNFGDQFSNAIISALGLEDRKIHKLILTMEVNKPISLQIDEYATFDDGQPYLLAHILELASWDSGDALPSESNSEGTETNG